MIGTVRTALQRLGAAGVDDLRAETGLSGERVATALEQLVRMGYAQKLAEASSPPAAGARAVVCRSCPLKVACPSSQGADGSAQCGAAVSSAPVVWLPLPSAERDSGRLPP